MEPYVLDRQRRRRWFKFRIKIYLSFGVLFLAAIGGFYALRESDFFRIQKLEVSGLEAGLKDEFLRSLEPTFFESYTARFLGPENYFSWPQDLEFSDLEFASVTVHKDLLNRSVEINVRRREPLGVWCVGGECLWFDNEAGIIMGDAPQAEGQLVFSVNEATDRKLSFGSEILSARQFENFKKTLEGLRALKISVKELWLLRELQEIKAVAAGGAELIFSLRFDPSKNVFPALAKLLSTAPLSSIQYINMTVENKIYMKNR